MNTVSVPISEITTRKPPDGEGSVQVHLGSPRENW
jgi:hypothetical protein